MSTNSQDQEIDLGQVFQKIGNFFQSIIDKFFDVILFVKRNIILLAILFIVGAGLGFYLDITDKTYNNEIIVTPNFGSVDYLYSKIALLEAKKKENDTVFFSNLGFKNVKDISNIEIEPVIDVFKFVDENPSGFELIKLMAEDGDINEIIEEGITSKNYPIHLIKFSCSNKIEEATSVIPLLNYLNDSDYYNKIKNQSIENKLNNLIENDSTIDQINSILNNFKDPSNKSNSQNLIYYNDKNDLNNIITTKNNLIIQKGLIKLSLINNNSIIKEVSITLNKINTKGLNGKMKFVLPLIFVFIFIVTIWLKTFYKNQIAKRNLA